MQTIKVGIREFRDNLANYLLESEVPLAITRHGDTVGFYLPARRKRTETDREALAQAASKLQQVMESVGITEEEVISDFNKWRTAQKA